MSNQDFNAIPTPSKPGDNKDIESQSLLGADHEWGSEAAMEKILRRGFLKKVYGILSLQMMVTVGFVALFLFDDNVKLYTQENQWVFYISIVVFKYSSSRN